MIEKSACDAFLETRLDALLQERGITHLIIVGCATDFCVDTTVRSAGALRFMIELGKYSPPGYASFNADEVGAHLLQGTAAMLINWPAWISSFSDTRAHAGSSSKRASKRARRSTT